MVMVSPTTHWHPLPPVLRPVPVGLSSPAVANHLPAVVDVAGCTAGV